MNSYQQKPQGGPQTLRIIHGALMMGMTLFFLVTLYLHANDKFFSMDPNVEVRDHSMFFYAVPAIVLGAYTMSILVARSMPVSSKNEYYRRFQQVMTRHIVRIAPIEGAGLFIIVSFLLTGNTFFLIYLSFIYAGFIAFFPTHNRIQKWIGDGPRTDAGRIVH